jgi:GGDEF domain-containing protein
VVGRIGGDEMGMLLVEQGPEGASAVTDPIAARVLGRRAALGLRSSWDLTIGTAAFPQDGETFDDLLRAADLRLYEQRGIRLS